ncbi:MAG: hypothetical protein ROZ09_15105 [Thiobacillus sp.]|uniref:hypothetical protein n=1 Tax=Thiobacillus sp. TaxID=924 RepID=UPI0028950795|nr:hypothetical protein [Thiobacillus sp.]MDT3708149.1 hypothetical protein [Thiobacillus sp.]
MKSKLLAALIASATLIGCAVTPNPQRQALLDEINKTTPTCAGAEDCNAKWDAAQLWVVHNAGYKIQTATNVLIETYNPAQYSPGIAVLVTKEPMGGGAYRIPVKISCANIYGCQPDRYKAALDFNRVVGAATP